MLPVMNYGRALVLYKVGLKDEAGKQFLAAMKRSPKVAKELVKEKHIKPKDYGKSFGVIVGSQDEAYEYWRHYGKIWKSTLGVPILIRNCLAKAQKNKYMPSLG